MRGSNREEKLNAMLEAFNSQNEKANARDPEYQKRRAEFERLNSHNKSYNTSSNFEGGRRNLYARTDNFRQAHKRSDDAYNDLMTTIRIHQAEAEERMAQQEQSGSENKAPDTAAHVSLNKDTYSKPGDKYRNNENDSSYNRVNAMFNGGRNTVADDDGFHQRLEEFERYNSRNATYTLHGSSGMSVSRGSTLKRGRSGRKRWDAILIGIVTIFLGSFMLFLGISRSFEQRRLRKECTVVVSAEKTDMKSGTIYYTRIPDSPYVDHIYSYTYEDKDYTAEWRVFTKHDKTRPPEQISMYISPSEPSEYYIPQNRKSYSKYYLEFLIFGGLGVILLIGGSKK